jgi:dynein heavy chain 1
VQDEWVPPGLQVQRQAADVLVPFLAEDGLVDKCLAWVASRDSHIMDLIRLRVIEAMFSLVNKGVVNIIEYNQNHADFALPADVADRYVANRLCYSIMWGFGGSMPLVEREALGTFIAGQTTLAMPALGGEASLLDYWPSVEDGEWKPWTVRVPQVEVESHLVASPDVVIPTVDTVRHEDALKAWLAEHRPVVLCGPPGSGKTMTLMSSLKALPDLELVSLNFSSATTPELLLKTFDQHCEYKRTQEGTVLQPTVMGKWLVIFCDECNLPAADKYGTQRVITFLRQLVEQNGFWRTTDHQWITLHRIQFVGACNPPTDAGRVPLTHRFLRHVPLLLVDFPSAESLRQIYGTFYRALLKLQPALRGHAGPLTEAMVEFYLASQQRFVPDMQAHYIYSPRELSRWMRALLEAIKQVEGMTLEDLMRLWVHEGLRLFQDRLVTRDEAKWTDETIDAIVLKHFPNLDSRCLQRPILFSNWLSKDYARVEREALRDHVKARLKVFYEEELDVPLVVFDEVLDHILRIDRVLRQPQGHALLIGVSGGGKTVLSRFVAWMNGQSIFTIKVNNRYTAEDFDDDLRHVMKRAGCSDERICFIFDESNVLDSAFLERMNTLLASGEVPGLFEGEEWTSLMHACREAVQRHGLLADTEDEMYKWFTLQVRRNLHIIFTMNPASPDFHNRSATSPALFNRCVLDWFGEWSASALFQVGSEFTQNVDLDDPSYQLPSLLPDLAELPLAVADGVAPSHREAVVAALVYIHSTINEANMLLHRQSGRSNYVTPRHYLDFISHLVHLVGEKREELEEQQLHVNVGLQKLLDTQQQVADLQRSLKEKSKVLEAKQSEANEKLAQMVQDQQVAEQKRAAAQVLSGQMEKQNAEIQVKKERAYADLEKAEPAVEEARSAVSGIRKEHLDEIRALARPPDKVKKTLEAVSILLHHKKLDWNNTRKLLMDKAFIPSIVQFDSNAISAKDRQAIQAEYLSDKEFNFESVNRASKACGPLVSWIIAQISYSDILNRIQPLRQEVADLEAAASDLSRRQDELQTTIADLERSIGRYKDEYAALIAQAQAIKTEMATVSAKVERSIALLSNLSSERDRWDASSAAFKAAMATVVGDSILAAAFVAYIGVFDQRYRTMLLAKWKTRLIDLGLTFKTDLSVVEYLSDSDRRLAWHANSLPADELCVENAIMLERFNRYPLVIDPSGQASEFLMQQYRDRKIKKTSFLDSAFMKNLESALRFGTPLLVEDVESIDPVLNPVLNKEIRKTGGRILIRLGDQDVDFSPAFVIFLSTRDPNAHFTPDLCSRVTFVNFTVTPGSLQEQCLHEVLRAERPDIHQKRVDLMKLQGEFKVRLRGLEKALLEALNESQGSILDNDHVIATLERLKTEAGEINRKMRETETVMEEISAVSSEYNPLALACSSIYFALEQAASIHFLYQFSLRFFLALFRAVLHDNPKLAGVRGATERLAILSGDMFSIAFQRVARTLLHEDQLPFALRLLQIRLRDAPAAQQFDTRELDFLLKGADVTVTASVSVPPVLAALPFITEGQAKYLAELEKALPGSFAGVVDHVATNVDQWRIFFEDANGERAVPESWLATQHQSTNAESVRLFRTLTLLKGLRPDRIIAGGSALVQALFAADFIRLPELDLGHVVEREAGPSTPLMLCSMPGYDASYKVDELAAQTKKPYKSLAIGSAEGFDQAEKAIQAGAKAGTWVLLKNVHLAPQWLVNLEKKLHSLEAKPGFRLFLTSEVHPAIPGALLRLSRVLVFEPPPGVRANLEHILAAIPAERMAKAPVERSRLHFLLAWLHAVVQERLRYAPLGWSKTFEFNESDMRCALDTIDTWVDVAAHGRNNLPPERIPWSALKTLLAQTVYGGRIDNPFDQRLLESFLDYLFKPQAFDEAFALTPSLADADRLTAPEGKSRDDFARWVRDVIPKRETPGWLGLPENAEMMLLVEAGRRTLGRLLKLQSMEDDEGLLPASDAAAETEALQRSADPRPAWIQALHASADKWLLLIPAPTKTGQETVSEERLQDPLYRCFDREVRAGRSLVTKVRHDLGQVIQACKGEIKQTNYLRALITDLSKGVVPKDWRRYAIPESVGVGAWLVDLAERLQQLERLSGDMLRSPRPVLTVWLGGLFLPEAFITATRQAAARAHAWSLEHLELHLLPSAAAAAAEPDAFVLQGLTLEGGAGWREDRLAIVPQLFTSMPDTAFVWRHTPDLVKQAQTDAAVVNVPVYINGKRTEFLFDVDMPSPAGVAPSVWYQRGLALTAWARDRT